MLIQRGDDLKFRPLEFASRVLSPPQKKYSINDREVLAIGFGLSKFKYQVYGYPVTVLTDHLPLLGIFSKKDLDSFSPRMVRLILSVQNFQPKIVYLPGKFNGLTDLMSRLNEENLKNFNAEMACCDFG